MTKREQLEAERAELLKNLAAIDRVVALIDRRLNPAKRLAFNLGVGRFNS